MKRIVLSALVLILLMSYGKATLEPRWDYDPLGQITKIYAEDIDKDGSIEILVGTNSAFYQLTYNGKSFGSFKTDNPINDFYFSGDRILLASDKVYSLLPNGIMEWDFDVDGEVNSVYALDIDNDGKKEIIAGGNNIYVLSDEGNLIWNYPTDKPVYQVYAQDLNKDGSVEIIAGSFKYEREERRDIGKLYVLDSNGKLIWTYETPVQSLKVSDLDKDDLSEIILGSNDRNLYVLSNDGKLKWSFSTEKPVTNVYVEDLDGDGFKEIIASSHPFLYVFNKDGKEIWKQKLAGSAYDIFVTDLENDGIKDILVGSYVYAYLFDYKGNLKDKWRLENRDADVKGVYAADLYTKGKKNIILGYNWLIFYMDISVRKSRIEAFDEIPGTETTPGEEKITTPEEDIDSLYKQAKESYILKDYKKAKEYAEKAKKLYSEAGDKSKSLSCEVLILKIQADESYTEAENYFISMDYEKAIESAKQAKNDYLEFQKKFTDFKSSDTYQKGKEFYLEFESIDWRTKIDSLLDKSEKYLKAKEYYEKSQEYYRNKDYENANKYAQMAKNIYKLLDDKDMFSKVEGLITSPSLPEAPIGKSVGTKGEEVFPALYILLAVVAIVVIFVVYRQVKKGKKLESKGEDKSKEKI